MENLDTKKSFTEVFDSLENKELTSDKEVLENLNAVFAEEENNDKSLIEYLKEKRENNDNQVVEQLDEDSVDIENFIDGKYDLLSDNRLYKYLVDNIKNGTNTLSQRMYEQVLVVNDDWIEIVEQAIISVMKIAKAPKTSIREDYDLINVEKAKRVDSVAVKHLSSHTEFIKELRSDNTVVPSKILTRQLEIEEGIYENKFVYLLILRLVSFVERRYKSIKDNILNKTQSSFNVLSSFKAGSNRVKYNLKMDIFSPSKDKSQSLNDGILERLDNIKLNLDIIKGTTFFQNLSKLKPIKSPIMKTNIILKNVDYRNCYTLWTMLSRYTSSGYKVTVSEKDLLVDQKYFNDLTKVVASSVELVTYNNFLRDKIYRSIRSVKVDEKKFRFVRKTEFEIDKDIFNKDLLDDPQISEYYFDKIKKMVNQITLESKASVLVDITEVKTDFRIFYKGLQSLNNELYYDLLKMNDEEVVLNDYKKLDKINRNKDQKRIKLKIKKQKLLIQLKKEELILAERRLNTIEKSLEKRMKHEEYQAIKDAKKLKEEKLKAAKNNKKLKK